MHVARSLHVHSSISDSSVSVEIKIAWIYFGQYGRSRACAVLCRIFRCRPLYTWAQASVPTLFGGGVGHNDVFSDARRRAATRSVQLSIPVNKTNRLFPPASACAVVHCIGLPDRVHIGLYVRHTIFTMTVNRYTARLVYRHVTWGGSCDAACTAAEASL